MTRHYYIICFLVLGIVSNVFCQTKDPKIVRDEELAELNQALKDNRMRQCLQSISKVRDEINEYIVKTQCSSEYVDTRLRGFIENTIVEQPVNVSAFPSTPEGHVVACGGGIAALVVWFSNKVAEEANDYETQQALSRLNLG